MRAVRFAVVLLGLVCGSLPAFAAPNNAIGQSLYKNLPFNHVRDTTPIAGIMQLANIMVVPPSLPVKTVAEFIAYAKANPGKLTFASSGNGTSVHMSGELFKFMTQIDIVHVPYRGSAGIYPDLLTGKVDTLFDNLPGVVEFVKAGKLPSDETEKWAKVVKAANLSIE